MSRLAIIDIGTQSILYLISEYENSSLRMIDQSAINVRLGELDADSNIQLSRLESCARIIEDLKMQAESAGADKIIAVGTAVFRKAVNGQDAALFLAERSGIPLQILSEKEEALLSFGGATDQRELDGDFWVFDVGGGSTECILGSKNGVIEWTSLPLGAVVLNRLLQGDPPDPVTVKTMQNRIQKTLMRYAPLKSRTSDSLIGVGGTITTLATMEQGMTEYQSDAVDGTILDRTQLEKWMQYFEKTDLAERCQCPGLPPKRADIIMAGTAIFLSLLDITGQTQILVSDRGLRYGFMLQAFMQDPL